METRSKHDLKNALVLGSTEVNHLSLSGEREQRKARLSPVSRGQILVTRENGAKLKRRNLRRSTTVAEDGAWAERNLRKSLQERSLDDIFDSGKEDEGSKNLG